VTVGRRAAAALGAALLATAACSAPSGSPTLDGRRPCPAARGFTCGTVRVPLDRTGRVPGGTDLQVAVADTPAGPRVPDGDLPDVPTLLLGGDRDLSTPVAWLRAEARLVPNPTVVIVPDATHSVQSNRTDPRGRDAVADFLLRP